MRQCQTRLSNMMMHDSVTDQMAVPWHQHPVVQKSKGLPAKEHAIGVNKTPWISQRTGTHRMIIEAPEHPSAGNERSTMLMAGLHEPGNVFRRIPVVGIKESNGLHTKANGVETANQSRC